MYTRDAVQLGLIALLYAQFPNIVCAPVVCLFVLCKFVFFRLVYTPDITNHMAGESVKWVGTKQSRTYFYPGEAKALRGKPSHLLVGEPGSNGNGVKAFGLLPHFLKSAPVAPLDIDNLGKPINQLVHGELRFRGRDLKRVSRVIGCQNNPIPVHDHAPIGHDRHNRSAVTLSLFV